MSWKEQSFRGFGIPYIRPFAASSKMRDAGNNSELQINVTIEEKKLANWRSGAGGSANSISRIESGSLALALRDFTLENLALAMLGDGAAVTGTTVTDEVVSFYKGGLTPLAHLGPSLVTATNTDGNTTYTVTTDYEVRNGGLWIPETSTIVDGSAGKVDYTYPNQEKIEAMLHAGIEVELLFDGVNAAKDDLPFVALFYRVKLSAAQNLGLITDDFGTLNLTGELLPDTSRGDGISTSQYMKWLSKALPTS